MPNRIEHVASKMVESYRGVNYDYSGLSGVFEDLAQEHSEIMTLLRRVATNFYGENRREMYSQVRQQLLAHEIFELEEVYPVLSRHDATRQLVAEHAEDAAQFDTDVRKLDSLDINGPQWQKEFNVLMGLFEQHVEQEEYDYFPEAQAVLADEETERLQAHFIAAKHAAPKHS